MTGPQNGAAGSCPQCGSAIAPSARFCGVCGHTLTTRNAPPAPVVNTGLAPGVMPAPQTSTAEQIQPAGSAVRCSAFLLDLAAMLSPALPLSIAGAVLGVAEVVYIVVPVAFVAVWAWLQTWQGLTGSSFGKAMLGLRLVRTVDRRPPGVAATFARSLLFAATAGVAGLPVAFGPSGQPGLHDRVSGLTVLDVAVGANPLGPRPQRTLRRRPATNRGLHQVHSPIPVSRRG